MEVNLPTSALTNPPPPTYEPYPNEPKKKVFCATMFIPSKRQRCDICDDQKNFTLSPFTHLCQRYSKALEINGILLISFLMT